jgi:hypothetical protein
MRRRIAVLVLALAAVAGGVPTVMPHPSRAVAADYDKWGKIAFPEADGPPIIIGTGRP